MPVFYKEKIYDFESVKRFVEINDPCHNEKYSRRDEVTLGKLFADCFKRCAKYNTTSKKWEIYNRVVWRKDQGNVISERYAEMLYEALYQYAFDKDADYKRYVNRLGNLGNRRKMLEDAQKHCYISQEDFDRKTNLINLLNVTIDINTGAVYDHNPDDLITKVCNVTYKKDATCELWEKTLAEVLEGDTEKIRYLNKLLALPLRPSKEEFLVMLYGQTTRNGKTTVTETIGDIYGDYASSINPESLACSNRDSRTASPDIAKLRSVRYVKCSEPPKRMILDTAKIKTLTGHDSISARQLYENEFEFVPEFTLFVNTNYLPIITDDTVFSSGRIKILSFNRHFEEAEQDKDLKQKLKDPDSKSGIFNWLLHGLELYDKEGLNPPKPVIEDTEEYRRNSDKIFMFMSEELKEDTKSILPAGDVFETFTEWCKANNFGVESKKSFYNELRSRGLLSALGTINGRSVKNVIKGYKFDNETDFEKCEDEEIPFK